MRNVKRTAVAGVLSFAVLMAAWIGWDLHRPARNQNLRVFDTHEVARLETAMWRSYYEHRRLSLFRELAELLERQYGMPFWRAQIAAYHAARAAVVFQRGGTRSDYEKALPNLESYYALVERGSTTTFDVRRVAALELEWWIVHRERARHDPRALTRSLADLQVAIYNLQEQEAPPLLAEHAQLRADAMLLRDKLAESGRVMSEQEWRTIGGMLNQSWLDLRRAVDPTFPLQ